MMVHTLHEIGENSLTAVDVKAGTEQAWRPFALTLPAKMIKWSMLE
jgi:hypothetical protein